MTAHKYTHGVILSPSRMAAMRHFVTFTKGAGARRFASTAFSVCASGVRAKRRERRVQMTGNFAISLVGRPAQVGRPRSSVLTRDSETAAPCQGRQIGGQSQSNRSLSGECRFRTSNIKCGAPLRAAGEPFRPALSLEASRLSTGWGLRCFVHYRRGVRRAKLWSFCRGRRR